MIRKELLAAVGLRIRHVRKKAGLSQNAMADALGTDRTYISKIENGSPISLERLFDICKACKITPKDFFDDAVFLQTFFGTGNESILMSAVTSTDSATTVWDMEQIKQQLEMIEHKGFIPIPATMYRDDDGIIGQIIEREFVTAENNKGFRDLTNYELKAMRLKKKVSGNLTLFHKTSSSGLKPIEIFERFKQEAPSKRDPSIIKWKLFTSIYGNKENNMGFKLEAVSDHELILFNRGEELARWDITEGLKKIDKMILVFAETTRDTRSNNEQFHYLKAVAYENAINLAEAVNSGAIFMDLCIDQPRDESKAPHDRGPHIRINLAKLDSLYANKEVILDKPSLK